MPEAKKYRWIGVDERVYLRLLAIKNRLSEEQGRVVSFSDAIAYLLDKEEGKAGALAPQANLAPAPRDEGSPTPVMEVVRKYDPPGTYSGRGRPP